MDSKDTFLEQSLGGKTKKDMKKNQYLTPCHICVFSRSRFSSQVESINLSVTNGGGKTIFFKLGICVHAASVLNLNSHLDLDHPKVGNIK